MAKKIVTIYIDDSNLRLMVVHGKRIKKWADLPLEPGLVVNNVVVKGAEVAACVKQLLKDQKVRTKKIVVGLSGLHCLSRPITLPQVPRAMLAEAVMREAKRVLPVSLEQYYISWQTIPAKEGEIRVFLVAIPRKPADALLKMLRQMGLKPYLVDLKPLALARAVKEPMAIIVDIQPTEFDIVIVVDGVLQPIRTIAFPSETLSRQDKLMMVKEELSRTIEFYNSNNPEKPLTSDIAIYTSGGLAGELEAHNFLAKELEHPVLPLSSPIHCPEQLDLASYTVNIGLALKELSLGEKAGASAINLNVLPAPYRPKPFPLGKVIAVPGAAVVIGLLVLMAMFIKDASASIDSGRSHLDTSNRILEQKQVQKKKLLENIAELEGKLAAVGARGDTFTTALGNLDDEGNVINGDLEETTNSLSGGVSLTGISHTGAKLTVQGSSPSEVEVLSYASSLDTSGRFPEVIIASINRVEGEGMDFILVLKTGGEG
ncbi:pilus assembly protein PilM [Chloroflexota bacterium]